MTALQLWERYRSGDYLERPLLLPRLFGLAAKLAQCSSENMLTNPAKMTLGFTTAMRLFAIDGVIAPNDLYTDILWLKKALSGKGAYELPAEDPAISVRWESIYRMVATPGRTWPVIASIPGPIMLARQAGCSPHDMIVQDLLLSHIRRFGEVRVDGVVLDESGLTIVREQDRDAYMPVINSCRFFNLPLIIVVPQVLEMCPRTWEGTYWWTGSSQNSQGFCSSLDTLKDYSNACTYRIWTTAKPLNDEWTVGDVRNMFLQFRTQWT